MSIKNLKDWWDIALRKEEYIKKTLLFEDDGAWSDGGVMNTSTLKSRNLKLTLDKIQIETRSSWLNCSLRDDEAVYWVSIGHYEAVAIGNWWYWVSRGHSCLYILQKVEIWTGVTDAWLTDNFER